MVTNGDIVTPPGDAPERADAVTSAERDEIHRKLADALREQLLGQSGNIRKVMEGTDVIELLSRCQVYALSVEDLKRPGGIGDAYGRAHMSPDTVQRMLDGQASEYMRHMGDGRFVFGFDEEPLNLNTGMRGPSVFQQMKEGLERTPDEQRTAGKFQGWFLAEAKNGPVHAWATCTFRPENGGSTQAKGKAYDERLSHTLEWGTTGGTMRYSRCEMEDLLPMLQKFWYFDTIQGPTKYAAHLLFADVVAEVCRDHPELEEILLYRLETLDFRSRNQALQFEELPAVEKFSAQNMKSTGFFRNRGCDNFAYDHNALGFASLQTVGGREIYCIPGWEWMRGNMKTVDRLSQEIKQAILAKKGITGAESDGIVVA